MTSFHNFKAAHDFYGEIRLKEYSDSSEQWLPILKTGICLIDLDTMPTGKQFLAWIWSGNGICLRNYALTARPICQKI